MSAKVFLVHGEYVCRIPIALRVGADTEEQAKKVALLAPLEEWSRVAEKFEEINIGSISDYGVEKMREAVNTVARQLEFDFNKKS